VPRLITVAGSSQINVHPVSGLIWHQRIYGPIAGLYLTIVRKTYAPVIHIDIPEGVSLIVDRKKDRGLILCPALAAPPNEMISASHAIFILGPIVIGEHDLDVMQVCFGYSRIDRADLAT
jgi:hypothetical protein